MASQKTSYDGLKKVIGLDIGATSIKAALLELQAGAPICRGMYSYEIPAGMGLTKPVLLEGLRNVASAFGSETKAVALLTADRELQLKFVEKPAMTRKQLDQVMELLMKPAPNLEGPAVDLAHAYTILGQSTLEESTSIHLLVASYPIPWALEKESLLKEAGLTLEGLYPYPTALQECFWINYGETFEDKVSPYLVAVLNMGATANQVLVCDLHIPRLARTFPFAGDELTQTLAKSYKSGGQDVVLDRAMAEKYKTTIGILSPSEASTYEPDAVEVQVSEGIRRGMERMMQKVRLSLDYFKGQMKSQVSQAYVFGGAANLRGLEIHLRDNLTVNSVHALFPFKNIPFLPKDGQTPDPRMAPAIVPAVGAGLCGMRSSAATLNLMDALRTERKKKLQMMLVSVLVPALCILVAAVTPLVYVWMHYLPWKERNTRAIEEGSRLSEQFSSVSSSKGKYDQLVNQQRELKIRTTFIQTILKKRTFWSKVLLEIGNCMPPEVWVSDVGTEGFVSTELSSSQGSGGDMAGGGMPGAGADAGGGGMPGGSPEGGAEPGAPSKPPAAKGTPTLYLSGQSQGFGPLSVFIKNLESSDFFEKIEWKKSERLKGQGSKVEFSVTCRLRTKGGKAVKP